MKVALIGGFCEMVELCQRAGLELVGFTDPRVQDFSQYGVPYLGTDDQFGDMSVAVVPTPDAPALRAKIAAAFRARGFSFATVIGRTADVSPTAQIGEGVVVAEHVIVNAAVRLGAFVKVNAAATIMHECVVGDYVTIAPRAVLLGRVQVGGGAYIGANATVLPGITIDEGATIGAGAVVTKDVPAGQTWAGVPARELRK